jgi:hypothetical protein
MAGYRISRRDMIPLGCFRGGLGSNRAPECPMGAGNRIEAKSVIHSDPQ